MILKRISVKNFRSIRDVTVEIGTQMAIVGANGAGKSTILRAVDKFYGQTATVELDDFFGRQTSQPIEIALTFTNLNASELELFASRLQGTEMTVARVFDTGGGKGNGRYYGVTRQHPPFAAIRSTAGATQQRAAYNALRTSDAAYTASLPTVANASQIEPAFTSWEEAHPDDCDYARDDGQFFGFTNVARGALQKATSFVFIPAVRDASADALDARGAVISRLLELVVRSAIQRRSDIQSFQARVSEEYRDLTNPEKLHELGSLSVELTDTLQVFYKEAAVALRWQPTQDFSIPLPVADVLLDDDGFEGPVDRKGHGLQRAFILTLLQHLAKATSYDGQIPEPAVPIIGGEADIAPETDPASALPAPYSLPGLILAIEEPELYQHPTKQRHFAKVLSQLSSGQLTGVARQTQVLFATHSSLFVSMDRFEEISLARRQRLPGSDHKECRITNSSLAQAAARLEYAFERPPGTFSPAGLRSRLHIISPEIAEGFFADAVVLVEGVSDKAAIMAGAMLGGIDLEALGIAVLPVDGKSKLDRPAAILTSLEIPTFLVWDCDLRPDRKGVDQNRALQRLFGVEPTQVVDHLTTITATFACFETKLEKTLKEEVGEALYEAELNLVKARYGIVKNDDAEKAPFIMRELLEGMAAKGKRSETLTHLVRAIVALRDANFQRSPSNEEAVT